MLIIITNTGTFTTEESKESIIKKIKQTTDSTISFVGTTKEVSLGKDKDIIRECEEIITLDLEKISIIGYKEYINLGEEKKAVPISLEDDLLLLEKEIKNLSDRKNNIKEALKDDDFIEYQKAKLKFLETKKVLEEKKKFFSCDI